MKTTIYSLQNCRKLGLVLVLAAFLPNLAVVVADETNAPTSATPASNAPTPHSIKIGGGGLSITVPDDARYPLPRDVLDRMTPEQILELEKNRHRGSHIEHVV